MTDLLKVNPEKKMTLVTKVLGVFLALGSAGYCNEMTQEKWEGFSSYFEADRSFRAKHREAYGEWYSYDLNSDRTFRLESGVEVKASNQLLENLSHSYEIKMPDSWKGIPLYDQYKSFSLGKSSNDTLQLRQIYGKICNLQFSPQDWQSLKLGLLSTYRPVMLGEGAYQMIEVKVMHKIPSLLENSMKREDKGFVVRFTRPTTQDHFTAFMVNHQQEYILAEFKIEPISPYSWDGDQKRTVKPYLSQ